MDDVISKPKEQPIKPPPEPGRNEKVIFESAITGELVEDKWKNVKDRPGKIVAPAGSSEHYEKWCQDVGDLWMSNPEQYEGKVKNYYMSPHNLEYYWRNKNSAEDSDERWFIRNSIGNRTPNYSNATKRYLKYMYLIGSVCYVRDYNVLPTSIIIPKQGDREFPCQLAKDRGTWNFYFSKKDAKQNLKFWERISEGLRNSRYSEKWRVKLVVDKIDKLIAKKKPFSLKEAVPTTIWNEWYNDEDFINVRVKFEYYEEHAAEMDRMNNDFNLWVLHNTIMNDSIVPLTVKYPQKYSVDTLDVIYDTAKEKPLFQGNHNVANAAKNQAVEEYEGFIPWIIVSLRECGLTRTEFVSTICRENAKNTKRLKDAYKTAFQKGEDVFIDTMGRLETIADCLATEKYQEAYKQEILNTYPKGTPARNKKQNVLAMGLDKWDTFVVCANDVLEIVDEIHGMDRITTERVNDIAGAYFRTAKSKLKAGLKAVVNVNTGLENRYDAFWTDVYETTVNEILAAKSVGYDKDVLYEQLLKDAASYGYGKEKYTIFDRRSSTHFEELTIDWNGSLADGHLVPTKPKKYGNVVLHPPLDNHYNNNKPINDINHYILQYQIDLDNWMKVNDLASDLENQKTQQRTTILLESWINQVEIKD